MIESLRKVYRRFKKHFRLFRKVNWTKTLYFNFKKFPYSTAKKLPVYFYGSVKFISITGHIKIEAPIKRGMIGFGQPYELVTRSRNTAEIMLEGTFVVKGHIQFGLDYFVHVAKNAYFEMGHMSSMASLGKLICKERIVLGNYVRIGSEAQLIDTNFHPMVNTKTGEKYPMTGSIVIGNFNYISNRVTIKQKTVTPNNCTVASNTFCNSDYTSMGEFILIGGFPAKLIREHISRDWEEEWERFHKNLILE